MSKVLDWLLIMARGIGADPESLRNMNPAVKWMGGALLFFISFAIIVSIVVPEPPKSAEQKAIEATAIEREKAVQEAKWVARKKQAKENLVPIFFWTSVISFGLAALIEPKRPKRDGRFKTGYKNNATVRRKTSGEIRVQRTAITIGIITAILWKLY